MRLISKMTVKLLDCTLRDGGYVNSWKFGKNIIEKIVKNLVESRVEIIELGYLQGDVFDNDTSLFQNILQIENLLKDALSFEAKNVSFYCMVNFGHFDVSSLPNLDSKPNTLHGIRLAFHKSDLDNIDESIKEIKQKGYDICIQPMITNSYNGEDLERLIRISNNNNVSSLYIVDSFGNLSVKDLLSINSLYDTGLKEGISIGLHLHDNMKNSLMRAVEFINNNKERNIIIDSTISGVGRGAGNLNTEIIASYLTNEYKQNYSTLPLLEMIDEYFELLMKEEGWGYSIAYFLSSLSNCHPNYASHYVNKKNLSVSSIKELLETIDTNKLLNFDMEYAEKHLQKYAEYNVCPKGSCFDLDVFREKNILLLGSGKTMSQYEEIIHKSIKKEKMIVISLNFIPDGIDIDYAFFSNEKRFAEFKDNKQLNDRLIVSSNIKTSQPHRCISVKKMSDGVVKTSNACLMMLNLFVRSSYTQVFLAGIDGFDSNRIDNYSYREYGQLTNKKELEGRNLHLIESFKKFKDVIICTSITPSNIIN